ncbi:MAG: carbohydrate porin [Phycisphaerales bacterium]
MMHQTAARLIAAASLGLSAHAIAQNTEPTSTPPAATPPTGIIPIPSYAGDLAERRFLLGDFDGGRTSLANKGLTFSIDWTQALQSVVDGGRKEDTAYGGGLDYLITLDLDRAGVMRGGVLKFRAESRYGESVNGDAGPISPVNFNAMVPLTDELDEGIPAVITDLNYMQFLSPNFAVLLGKIDTADGDANEFASGRGTGQFMNSNLVANGVFIIGLPYSTLAVGAVWLPDPNVTVTLTFGNAADSSTNSGFDDFGDGWLLAGEAQFQYKCGGLPGGVTLGGLYVGDSNFKKLSGHLTLQPGEGIVVPTSDHLWSLYANVWQYLNVADQSDKPVTIADGRPDRQGWGLFGRAGISDDDTNPLSWSLSAGIGGRGVIPGARGTGSASATTTTASTRAASSGSRTSTTTRKVLKGSTTLPSRRPRISRSMHSGLRLLCPTLTQESCWASACSWFSRGHAKWRSGSSRQETR